MMVLGLGGDYITEVLFRRFVALCISSSSIAVTSPLGKGKEDLFTSMLIAVEACQRCFLSCRAVCKAEKLLST